MDPHFYLVGGRGAVEDLAFRYPAPHVLSESESYPLVTWSSVAPSFTPNSCPAWIARFRRS